MVDISLASEIVGDLQKARQLLTDSRQRLTESRQHLSSKRDRLTKNEYDRHLIRLDMAVARMETWNETWNPGQSKSGTFLQALWGKSGQDHIAMLLRRIQRGARRICDNIQDMEDSSMYRWWALTARKRALSEQGYEISDLAISVDTLIAMSEIYFSLTHKASPDPISPSDSTTSHLKDIIKTRSHSQQLYRCCHASSPLVIYLHIDLSSISPSDATSIHRHSEPQYHFLTKDSPEATPWTHFIVERLEEEEVLKEDADPIPRIRSIREGLSLSPETAASSKKALAKVFSIRTSETGETAYFNVSTPPTNLALISPPESFENIHSSLQNMPFYHPNRPTLAARYNLAFQLVKCALYLLGTSWLSDSDIEGPNLMKATTADQKDLYLLLVPTSDTDDVNQDAQALSPPDFQIFRVGVLLIEIALERPLPQIRPDDEGEDMIPLLAMTRRIATSMGSIYAQAARFCLEQRSKAASGTGADIFRILAEFHQNVYLPITQSYTLFMTDATPTPSSLKGMEGLAMV